MAMPKALARYHARRSLAPRRPSPLIGKLREQVKRLRRRGGAAVAGNKGLVRDLTALAGGFALGKGEEMGFIPERIGPAGMAVDSALVVGGALAFAPKLLKLSPMLQRYGHDAALGVLGVAGLRLAQGKGLLGDDSESPDDLSGAGWGAG